MKRLIRIVSLVALCAMVAITFSGCYKDWLGKRPCDQYNTAWKSEDGSIHFYIGSGWGFGIADIGDEKKSLKSRLVRLSQLTYILKAVPVMNIGLGPTKRTVLLRQ